MTPEFKSFRASESRWSFSHSFVSLYYVLYTQIITLLTKHINMPFNQSGKLPPLWILPQRECYHQSAVTTFRSLSRIFSFLSIASTIVNFAFHNQFRQQFLSFFRLQWAIFLNILNIQLRYRRAFSKSSLGTAVSCNDSGPLAAPKKRNTTSMEAHH